MKKKHIVVIGGGFGGLSLVQKLRKAPVRLTLIDKHNHHLFQPLLYQVAVGALAPGDVATPLRFITRNQENIDLIMDEVTSVNRTARTILLSGGQQIGYDALVIATGNQPTYFGHDAWRTVAPGLKDLSDAMQIRERLFLAFEKASQLEHPAQRVPHLTFVIVGGGATGVELAGAIAEIGAQALKSEFRNLGPDEIRVVLIEGGSRLLAAFDPQSSARALQGLQHLKVQVVLNTQVKQIAPTYVLAGEEKYETENVIWAAGNEASPLLRSLDTPLDRAGRALIDADLSLPNDPDVYVIGDAAACVDLTKKSESPVYLPGVVQVAMQQGEYLSPILLMNVPKAERKPFRYFDKGTMATIGRSRAVAEVMGLRFSGFFAWLLWCFIHVLYLISSRNRFRVFTEWVWYYITFQPGSRLIYRSGTEWKVGSKQAAFEREGKAEVAATPVSVG